MKITLRKVVQAGSQTSSGRTPLQALCSLSLSPVKAWRRAETMEAVEAQIARFLKVRKETLDKHEAKGEDGRPLPVDQNHPHLVAIDAELGELLDKEITLDVEPTPADEIGEGSISADEMRGVKFLVSEPRANSVAASDRRARKAVR